MRLKRDVRWKREDSPRRASVAALQGGRLIDLGPANQVLTEKRLSKTFAVDAGYVTDPSDGHRRIRFA